MRKTTENNEIVTCKTCKSAFNRKTRLTIHRKNAAYCVIDYWVEQRKRQCDMCGRDGRFGNEKNSAYAKYTNVEMNNTRIKTTKTLT